MENLKKNKYCINCFCKECKYNEELTNIKAINTCDRCKECHKGSKAIEICGKYKKLCNKKIGQNKNRSEDKLKTITLIILMTLTVLNPTFAFTKEHESIINLINMPKEELFEIANTEYLPLPLKESLTDKTLQKRIHSYCLRRKLKYTDLLINLYKESNFKAWTKIIDGDMCYVGMGCVGVPVENEEEIQRLLDAWENAKEVTNIMRDIENRYQTKDLEETIICYQYGYWYLNPYRAGEYVPPKVSWYDRIEEAREYLRKQIIRVLLKQIGKGRVIESSVKTYNTHLPKDFKF